MVGNELMQPKSRTFIRSSVDDNFYLQTTGYRRRCRRCRNHCARRCCAATSSLVVPGSSMAVDPYGIGSRLPARWQKRDAKGRNDCARTRCRAAGKNKDFGRAGMGNGSTRF